MENANLLALHVVLTLVSSKSIYLHIPWQVVNQCFCTEQIKYNFSLKLL